MEQSLAIWILIGLALLTASLPFVSERPFLVLPWKLTGEPPRSAVGQIATSVVFFALLTGWLWLVRTLIGGALLIGGDLTSTALFLGQLVLVAGLAGVLMAYPGWRSRNGDVDKSFFVRLLELLVFYFMVGAVGFAFEANIGNRFEQGWEFYAITMSLYLVLAYPGFVYRYLMRRRTRRQVTA